ncbi:MAG: stage III sporulation protein AA [Clostridiales bacterium]|nr:stage III sporulation protein AA [Clostridiales bacterium]
MEMSYAIGRYEQAAELLPARWQQAARRVPDFRKAQAEEFRLRAGRPMTLVTTEGELFVSDELPRQSVTQADLEQLCDVATGYSRYAASEAMGKGYLVGRGGFRVGLCGTVVLREGVGVNLRDISSATVRISRQVSGLCGSVSDLLPEGEAFESTLIAAPPGAGKTTLLREMAAALSNGSETRPALRVGIVDERGELAGMYRGVPQLDVGFHTDVLDGCPKALGIPMLVRSANPQVIVVDEITAEEDLRAMTAAANCGVALLATIHALDGEELRRKPLFPMLEAAQVFRHLVTISVEAGVRRYRVQNL